MRQIITGDKVILRKRTKEDAPFFVKWYNDPKIMFQCGFTEPTTLEREERVRDTNDSCWYAVTTKNGELIGETGLLRMWPAWKCTDMSIILPVPEHQGKGCGIEVMELMLSLAFREYDMHRVAIGVVAKNEAALRFYRRIGFVEEGRQDDGYYYGGEYSDFIMMRILRHEWEARFKGKTRT